MSKLDIYHDAVRHALEKDGWTITHDPLTVSVGGRDVYVDLGLVFAAEDEVIEQWIEPESTPPSSGG